MERLLMNLIRSFIEGILEIDVINEFLMLLSDIVFYVENYFMLGLGANRINFNELNAVILEFAIWLIVLKFLKKGFDIYVGWYEGDKDADPKNFLVNFIRAIVTVLCFRFLYPYFVDVFSDFSSAVLYAVTDTVEPPNIWQAIVGITVSSITGAVMSLVLAICFIILWFKFILLGIEMFILRLGFPLACIGLTDSDKGVFAPYIKKFFMVSLTAIVQMFMIRLSVALIDNGSIAWGLAFCIGALKAPKMLQEFMFAYGSGGVTGAINMAHHTAGLAKFIKFASKAKGG